MTEKPETFHCSVCDLDKPRQHEGGTGYGRDPKTGALVCYECCAVRDAADMERTGETVLYLIGHEPKGALGSPRPTGMEVTNWPGTLRFPVLRLRKSRHNIARWRYDVWFRAQGKSWHGVTYGDNTQICHCKRLKKD